MIRLFTDHPRSVGETFLQHLRFACGFGFAMMVGGLGCFVHGLLPFLFQTTGSRTVLRLHDRMVRLRADTVGRWQGDDRREPRMDRRAAPEPEYLI